MKIMTKLIQRAKLATQANLCSDLICVRIMPAAIKMMRQATKQIPFSVWPWEICDIDWPCSKINAATNRSICRDMEILVACRQAGPKRRKKTSPYVLRGYRSESRPRKVTHIIHAELNYVNNFLRVQLAAIKLTSLPGHQRRCTEQFQGHIQSAQRPRA